MLAYSPTGERFACLGFLGHITVYDAKTMQLDLRLMRGHNGIAFSPNGRVIFAARKDGRIHQFDSSNGELLSAVDIRLPCTNSTIMHPHFSRDCLSLLAVSDNHIVRVNLTTLQISAVHPLRLDSAWHPQFSDDHRFATIIQGELRSLTVLNLETDETKPIPHPTAPQQSLAVFSHAGDKLAAALGDKVICLFATDTTGCTSIHTSMFDTVSALAFSPDDRHLVVASTDNRIEVIDLRLRIGHEFQGLQVRMGLGATRSLIVAPDNFSVISKVENWIPQRCIIPHDLSDDEMYELWGTVKNAAKTS